MLSLDDPRWAMLRTAYGPADRVPALLQQLQSFPPDKSADAEPYFSLFSALCHQGDVYTASYAASPTIVRMISSDPGRATSSALALVVSIELARLGLLDGSGPPIPAELKRDYDVGLSRLRDLCAALARRELDPTFTRVVCAALALANGQAELAQAVLELSPEVLPDFRRWVAEER